MLVSSQAETAFRCHVHRAVDKPKSTTQSQTNKGDTTLASTTDAAPVASEPADHNYSDIFVCHGKFKHRYDENNAISINHRNLAIAQGM
jgi:hypothetical protein